uniref:Ent-copalyl diphosphate synthase n=1 Tax=Andrographis paniculata TaxID=175694 RepID=A0A0M3M1F1_ANDPA|nr:ent-copalyl diphosphate synthase [Andrographis paniculata]
MSSLLFHQPLCLHQPLHRRGSPHALSTAGAFQYLKSVGSTCRILECNAAYKPHAEELVGAIQNELPDTKLWEQIVEDGTEEDDSIFLDSDKIRKQVQLIQSMLQSMGDGEITVSPYDTAWVAMVEDINSADRVPQFPSSVDWISNNQLSDGSWGDEYIFSIYDRIINTLGCVAALRSWNIHPEKSEKGISFIKANIHKLEDENEEHMPIGFEVALPSLLEIAKKLDIDIPYDAPCLQEIYRRRDIKLKKIPKNILHKVPTTLLHSLEGMADLEWDKLIKLQCADGSLLFSPSSTAFALQQTKDQNCLKYLDKAVQKFNGGVPNVYPVDLFEHIWVVDRLQRLGNSRYFKSELQESIDYVHRHWTNKGICWARNSEVQDIDDTAMAFRLMRLYGYKISADVFKNFQNGDEFFCFSGQSTQAVTGMYNLYRASQLRFPGEDILIQAKNFSAKYLQEKRANNELLDKWIITKDLPGEVSYALDVPWYANLPRVETRFYLEQYGGYEDVWIGKTLYRMPYVNNNTYLELAKLDFNNCQALHREELRNLQKWSRNCSLFEFGLTDATLLQTYHIVSASVFEPERSAERIAWAKTAILVETIVSHFHQNHFSPHQISTFVHEFANTTSPNSGSQNNGSPRRISTFVGAIVRTLNQLSLDMLSAHGRHVHPQIVHAWQSWLDTWTNQEGDSSSRHGEAELYLRVLNISSESGSLEDHDLLKSHPKYQRLLAITESVCSKLRLFQTQKDRGEAMCGQDGTTTAEIESEMEELVEMVVVKDDDDDDLESGVKQKFLTVSRSFYYSAYCNPGTISFHIAKVLFEKVL